MLEGYRGKLASFLASKGIEIGDRIRIKKDSLEVEGILFPSFSRDEDIIVVKMDNGYNVGLKATGADLSLLSKRKAEDTRKPQSTGSKGEVKIISTGGTIVSKVEYETGAVRPALSTDEILEYLPQIKDIADIDAEILFTILSENMKPDYWTKIAEKVKESLDKGARGVVIAHGTDTMSYTASAIAFSFSEMTGPVVLVGSQRSSDRPSSDSSINLYSSVILAKESPFAEVAVLMHGESSDTYTIAHRGVKVRKMHTSRRDAFQSINDVPLAKVMWTENTVKMLRKDFVPRGKENRMDSKFDPRVFLLYYYPGMNPLILEAIKDKTRGIVLAGTGLGHTSEEFETVFREFTKDGIFVGMTSQCLFGRVNMNVYTTGRKLLEAGVVPLGDMLPETALVKLMWSLAHADDVEGVKKLMLTNMVGEFNDRHNEQLFPRWYYE
ncbi:Glutamyl-tRNA(Gln) amidotransferase subunit D [Sulfuracidifex tepidarius]|uniref:Glutamyl-tRNA(Gln) amidotransferase subunit D n=1 Tax=Sulfuracidifex tepidarius TaxID=1294262 RepID=A0A510DUJ6_9CREN|nr:Glu-tRNA(Gln) amidotransferase subunit GatD [Sulfuracidifex tepidarius]BBG23849.1 Glutamyl-tRNA(Gln) amidotransferase subunit D [Sulfuracidifex tepidarius]